MTYEELVEKVAESIWEVRHPNPPGFSVWRDDFNGPGRAERKYGIDQARAAIAVIAESLKKVGKPMLLAADKVSCCHDWDVIWRAMLKASPLTPKDSGK